jgi:FkbM family methyltransferase
MYELLQRNVTLNGLTHVTTRQLAASDTADSATLAAFAESGGNFGVSHLVAGKEEGSSSRHFTVETQTLDAVLDDERIDTVDLLKMDIEGSEGAALDGLATSMQSGRVPRILLELHPSRLKASGRSAQKLIAVLRSFGYRGQTIDHSGDVAHRAHYGRFGNMKEWLIDLNPDDELDAWPHQLWVQGDVDPLVFDR